MPCFLMVPWPRPDDDHSRKQCEMLHKFRRGNQLMLKKKQKNSRPKIFKWKFLNHIGKFKLKTFSDLIDEQTQTWSWWGHFFVVRCTKTCTAVVLPPQPMTKQSSTLALWAEGVCPAQGPSPGAATARCWAESCSLSRCSPCTSCTVRCAALQTYFCSSRFISFQGQLCTAGTGIWCVGDSFLNVLLPAKSGVNNE